MKLSQLIDIVISNIFNKYLAWGITLKSSNLLNLKKSNAISQKPIMVSLPFLSFSKVCTEIIKSNENCPPQIYFNFQFFQWLLYREKTREDKIWRELNVEIVISQLSLLFLLGTICFLTYFNSWFPQCLT